MNPPIQALVSRSAMAKMFTTLTPTVSKKRVPRLLRLFSMKPEPPLNSRSQCSSMRPSSTRKRSVPKSAISTMAIL